MNNTKGDSDFLFALDYILNKANIREIDAFAAAIERRQGQLDGAVNGAIPFTPEEAAKKMSESIYASIDASMEGVRHTFRDYATDILQKEAPELSKQQIVDLACTSVPVSQIAAEVGVAETTVRATCRQATQPPRHRRRFTTDDLQRARQLHAQGRTYIEIGLELGFGRDTVKKHLAAKG